MKGLALWPNAGPNTRATFIALACDADQAATVPLRKGYGLGRWPEARERITIEQALEVLK